MRLLTIDRIEGIYAICEDNEGAKFAIPVQELPEGAKEGVCLTISDDGVITVDADETERRRSANAAKQKKLF